jgi:protein-tyrosine-phosphatase
VFVCEHGSAKSLLASSLFERMAKEQGVELRAVSRGTQPDESVPPAIVTFLRRDGFEVASFRPQALTEADVARATRVIAIGADLGTLAATPGARIERWDDIPPFSPDYAKASATMRRRVDALLQELRKR